MIHAIGDTLLSATNLVVEFPRRDRAPLRAVDGFSLSVRRGEFVCVLGATGCGKSTAALALAGLVRAPGKILSGRVDFDGQDLLALPEDQRNAVRGRDIGLIVQNPRTSLHPLLKIGTQISNVIRAHNKVGAREAWDRAVEMLRMVGINDPERRARAYQHELSTGMTQRVMIAMALSSKPKLLIADEPTSGLDVTIQTQFLDKMWEAAQATGSAVLLVTQNLGHHRQLLRPRAGDGGWRDHRGRAGAAVLRPSADGVFPPRAGPPREGSGRHCRICQPGRQ